MKTAKPQTAQNTISREEFAAWVNAGIMDKDDVRKIVALTRDAKMRDGQGYTDAQIRFVLRQGYNTLPEVVALIRNYYLHKKAMKDAILKDITTAA